MESLIFMHCGAENPPIKGGKAPQALGGVSVTATSGTAYRDIPLAVPHGNAVPLIGIQSTDRCDL